MLLSERNPLEALQMFSNAASIFEKFDEQSEPLAENLYCMAECLFDNGDIEKALKYGLKGMKMRQELNGSDHPSSVDSYQQIGKLYSSMITDGIITKKNEENIENAIYYYQLVFRFIKKKSSETFQKSTQSVLLRIIRTLISLKLKLIPQKYRDLVDKLRSSSPVYSEEQVKDVIVRLIHLSPTMFIEDLFHKLDEKECVWDLGICIQIAENSNLIYTE
jgi:tetratricopeptide (TPR) repeat protein